MSAHASQSQSGASLPTDLSAAPGGRRETQPTREAAQPGQRGKRSGRTKTPGSNPSGTKGSRPGKRGKKRRRVPRGALIPLLGSLAFHLLLMAVMFLTRPDPLRTRQLTDIEGFESMLSIPPPPMPDAEPVIEQVANDQPQPEPEPSTTDEFAAAASSSTVSPTFFNPLTQPRVVAPSSTPVSRLPTRPKPKVEQPAKPVVPKSAGFGQVQAQRASKVVYAVDVSGAMVPVLPFLLQELRRSVERLDESQSFQVIFFRASDVQIPDPPSMGDQLLAANRNSKRSLDKIVTRVDPGGRSDTLAGLSRAIALKPDVVFLLSRNIRRTGTETQSGEDLLTQLDRLNPKNARTGQRPVVIKTIQFIDEDPTGLMQAIAGDHGDGSGSYRVMSIADLKKQ